MLCSMNKQTRLRSMYLLVRQCVKVGKDSGNRITANVGFILRIYENPIGQKGYPQYQRQCLLMSSVLYPNNQLACFKILYLFLLYLFHNFVVWRFLLRYFCDKCIFSYTSIYANCHFFTLYIKLWSSQVSAFTTKSWKLNYFGSDLKCLLLFFQINNVSSISHRCSRDHGIRDRNVGLFDKNQTRLGTGKIV